MRFCRIFILYLLLLLLGWQPLTSRADNAIVQAFELPKGSNDLVRRWHLADSVKDKNYIIFSDYPRGIVIIDNETKYDIYYCANQYKDSLNVQHLIVPRHAPDNISRAIDELTPEAYTKIYDGVAYDWLWSFHYWIINKSGMVNFESGSLNYVRNDTPADLFATYQNLRNVFGNLDLLLVRSMSEKHSISEQDVEELINHKYYSCIPQPLNHPEDVPLGSGYIYNVSKEYIEQEETADSKKVIIPPQIKFYASDDDFIVAIQYLRYGDYYSETSPAGKKLTYPSGPYQYYWWIVDKSSGEVAGPMGPTEFREECRRRNVTLSTPD